MASATAMAYNLAEQTFDEWLADHGRCGWARTFETCTAKLRNKALGRVASVLGHPAPAAASRRWIVDTTQAWAPLEVIFPAHDYSSDRRMSGELPLRAAEIIEREYGFLLDASGSTAKAIEWLEADLQWLSLDLALNRAILPALHAPNESEEWLEGYLSIALALAEHAHREALGLEVLLAPAEAGDLAARLALQRRQFHTACRTTPCLVAAVRHRAA